MTNKPLTAASLVFAAISIVLDWYWPWGILIAWWVWSSLRSGDTYFVETIQRNQNPILFWTINLLWVVCAVAMFLFDLWPELMRR